MPQFRLFCYSIPLSACGKGSGLHSLKADLLNGLVEDADRLFLQDHRVRFARHIPIVRVSLSLQVRSRHPCPLNESKTA